MMKFSLKENFLIKNIFVEKKIILGGEGVKMWQKWPKILIFGKNKDFLLKWVFLKKGQKN